MSCFQHKSYILIFDSCQLSKLTVVMCFNFFLRTWRTFFQYIVLLSNEALQSYKFFIRFWACASTMRRGQPLDPDAHDFKLFWRLRFCRELLFIRNNFKKNEIHVRPCSLIHTYIRTSVREMCKNPIDQKKRIFSENLRRLINFMDDY